MLPGNVTVSFTHTGKGDVVPIKLAFPDPDAFENRWYLGGGGGYSISSDATGGIAYGAAGGATSAGYDAFNYALDEQVLYGNGSINWDAVYAFSYVALGELTKIGKPTTAAFYGLTDDAKLYSYFEGCSDGGVSNLLCYLFQTKFAVLQAKRIRKMLTPLSLA